MIGRRDLLQNVRGELDTSIVLSMLTIQTVYSQYSISAYLRINLSSDTWGTQHSLAQQCRYHYCYGSRRLLLVNHYSAGLLHTLF